MGLTYYCIGKDQRDAINAAHGKANKKIERLKKGGRIILLETNSWRTNKCMMQEKKLDDASKRIYFECAFSNQHFSQLNKIRK